MMKIRILIFILSYVSVSPLFAQKQNNVWYFGNHAGVHFNSAAPVALTNGALSTVEGCASIADKTSGKLLFYTDGVSVWNKQHTRMPNGKGLYGHSSSTQSALIVPMPRDSTKYYIFTSDQGGYVDTNTKGINYSIVDMTLDNGKGDVTVKNIRLLHPAVEKLTAVPLCDGMGFWVIAHAWGNNKFYAWALTSKGIDSPVVTGVGKAEKPDGTLNDKNYTLGYLKASPNGKKLALATNTMNVAELYDFDKATGIISNPIEIWDQKNHTSPNKYGVEFSPDNSKVYFTQVYSGIGPNFKGVFQYDLLAGGGNQDSINATKQIIYSSANFNLGALQLAPDGKIYLSPQGSMWLGIITNPNAAGAACNYVDSGVFLAGNNCMYGLPNCMNLFSVSLPPDANFTSSGSYVIDDTVFFNNSSINTDSSWTWYFGDPASGIQDASHLQNPYHIYSSFGTYTVTLIVSSGCQNDTIMKTVAILPPTIQTCAQAQAVSGKKPGDASIVSISLSPTEKVKNASKITLQLHYDNELLRVTGKPVSAFGDIGSYSLDEKTGDIFLTLILKKQLPVSEAELLQIPVQILLADHKDGNIDVLSATVEQNGKTIASRGCSSGFSVDESCIQTTTLKKRTTVNMTSIYPNPASHSATALIESSAESALSFEIVDVFGRILLKSEAIVVKGLQVFHFSTKEFPVGIYFCRIASAKTLRRALCIQR